MRISKHFVVSKVNVSNFNVGMVVGKNSLRYKMLQRLSLLLHIHSSYERSSCIIRRSIDSVELALGYQLVKVSFQGLSWP